MMWETMVRPGRGKSVVCLEVMPVYFHSTNCGVSKTFAGRGLRRVPEHSEDKHYHVLASGMIKTDRLEGMASPDVPMCEAQVIRTQQHDTLTAHSPCADRSTIPSIHCPYCQAPRDLHLHLSISSRQRRRNGRWLQRIRTLLD